MGSWIELHTTLRNHPKLEMLCLELGIKKVEGMGLLTSLWTWALDYAEDGDLSRFDPLVIERACGWDGGNNLFYNAMLGKFVNKNHLLHDWLDYTGRYLRAKYHTSNPKKLQQIQRLHKVKSSLTKVRRKSPSSQTDNLPTLPTLPTLDDINNLPTKKPQNVGVFKAKDLAMMWNENMEGYLSIVTLPLTDSRSTKIRIRLNEHPSKDWWLDVFVKVLDSPFLLGDGSSNWKVTLDWLVVNDKNALKVYENHYESKSKDKIPKNMRGLKAFIDKHVKEENCVDI